MKTSTIQHGDASGIIHSSRPEISLVQPSVVLKLYGCRICPRRSTAAAKRER